MKTYKNYIFDFDGVLVDSKDLSFDAINFALEKIFMDPITRIDFDSKSKLELIRLKKIGPIRSLILLSIAKYYFKNHINQTVKSFELFEKIKHIKQNKMIVSSNSKTNINLALKADVKIFSKVMGSVGHSSKHKVLKKYANESLYITDEVRDIVQCHKIGMDVIAVTWGLDSESELIKAKPLKVINDVGEFCF